jgi:cytochrome c biogenesis protein CcdA
MPTKNVIFAIVTPLVLMAIIAVLVVSVGETLLAVHHWAEHAYHVGDYATAEENKYWGEIAALPAVGVALGLATVFLLGGIVASMIAPQPKSSSRSH